MEPGDEPVEVNLKESDGWSGTGRNWRRLVRDAW